MPLAGHIFLYVLIMVTFENILRHQFVILKEKMKGELKAQTEKTETDRKRERRVKKYMKRKRQKERARREKLVQKLNPGLGNKYSKEKAIKELEKQSKAGKGVTMVQVGVIVVYLYRYCYHFCHS
jgi:hypothetical protein